jgi:hypothetical protein
MGAVWSVPVILAATAAPAAAASMTPGVTGSGSLTPMKDVKDKKSGVTMHPYTLAMLFTATGKPSTTTTVTILSITAAAPGESTNSTTFTPVPALPSIIALGTNSLGTSTVTATVYRDGPDHATTATVTFSYTEKDAKGAILVETGVASVTITG